MRHRRVLGRSDGLVNSQLLVIPMVVRNLDDILHVAVSDLGQSLGNSGTAAVRRVLSEVIPRIPAGGKFAGVGGNNPSDTEGVAEFIT